MCTTVDAQGNSHHRKECFTVWALSLADGNGHPPMAQLIPTKVMITLLLSCLVFVTHKHAMLQVHSWTESWYIRGFVAMATKHRDGRGKRPRSEVNACP